MKTPQEINDLLEQVKLQGRFRRTATHFVLVEVVLNLNTRLAALEYFVGAARDRLDKLERLGASMKRSLDKKT